MTWIREYFESEKERINNLIVRTSDQQILSKKPNDWIDELVESSSLPIIEEKGEPAHDYLTVRQGYNDYGRTSVIEVVYLEVDWHVVEHPKLTTTLSLNPSPHNPMLPSIDYKDGHIKFKIKVGNTTEINRPDIQEKTRKELTDAIEGHRNEFKARNREIEKSVYALCEFATNSIKKRIEEVQQKEISLKQLSEKMNIPLKKKTEEIKIISIAPKKDITNATAQKSALPSGRPKEFVIDRENFLTFISYIDGYMKSCERTSVPFCRLKEEEIRDLILPYLNQVFEKGATGETFSKFGKTDIYLVIDKGCILICECKWWRGSKSLEEVISQVLDRVTWRENYGVVIVFVKEEMSQVLVKAKDAIKNHISNIAKQIIELTNTHLVSRNLRTEDKNKTVEIHYLFYSLVSKEGSTKDKK